VRIALLTYSTRARGGVVHALELAEALAAEGEQVRLFALEKPGRVGFFRPTDVPVGLIPVEERPGESVADRIARYIDAYVDYFERAVSGSDYDIFHAEDCISANALIRLRRDGRVPAVVRTVHHVDDFTTPALVTCQDDSILEPDVVLVVSEWWRARLASVYGVEATVVHNGVDVRRFVPPVSPEAREEERGRSGLTGTVTVLAVGGVEPRKNSLVLLEAFTAVAPELAVATGRRPRLLFVGGETLFDYREYRDAFERRLADLAAAGRLEAGSVVITGPVEDRVLLSLYRGADLLAFPSVREGWGLTVLEAQACGTPVVASDIDVLREYLVDGRDALLVPPGDAGALGRAIVRATTDASLIARLRAGGLETARRFGWDSSARRHLDVYRRLLG